jgi:eukaryotic-like serine/threonine-protein kinase
LIGTTVGNYLIQRLLGEGGMGRVYVGEHQLIGKRAAIKVLLPQYSAQTEIVNRFFNEARASSLLKHPGVVDVYDFGRLADGSAYLVMEFLEGESLATRLHRGALPVELATDIARQVAVALGAAHARGIVHRDLKPDNVFLVPDDEMRAGVRAKVLDFGIAKLTDDKIVGNAATRTGAIIGTPTYMSPEQCRGAGKVDHRSDIYSLGCLLYEMVSGRPPFSGEGPGDVIAAHLFAPPTPLTGLVPPSVEQAVQRLLMKTPEARPQTMSEVVLLFTGAPRPVEAENLPTMRMPTVDALQMMNARTTPLPANPPPRMTTPLPANPRMTTPLPQHASHTPAAQMATRTPAPSLTTLGEANGEVTRGGASGSAAGRRVLVAGAAALVVGGGILLAWKMSSRAPEPPVVSAAGLASATTPATTPPTTTAPEATPPGKSGATPTEAHVAGPKVTQLAAPKVSISIVSQPAGAYVVRASDGARLGKTPWRGELTQSPDEAVFRLSLHGYKDATVTLPLAEDVTRTVELVARKAAPGSDATAEKSKAGEKKPIKNGVVDPFAD